MVKQGASLTHVYPLSHQQTDVPGVEVQKFGCTDQLVPGLTPDLHPHAGLGVSAEDEVGSGSVRESKMVANGQPHAR